MGKLLLISFLFSSLASFAAQQARVDQIKESLQGISNCQNFLKVDDTNVYLGYGHYSNSEGGFHKAKPTKIVVTPIGHADQRTSIEVSDSAIDLLRYNDRVYVLTYASLEEWDPTTWNRVGLYPTYENANFREFEEDATQMALYKNQLIISHGRLGFSIFDLETKKIVYQQKLAQERLPLESKVTGVAVIGDKAYFALDSFTLVQEPAQKFPFQGVIVYDLINHKIVSQLEGMEPGSDNLFAYGNRLIISFYGIPLLKFDADRLTGTRLPGPMSRISRFPEMGRLLGKPSLDDQYIYTCFQHVPEKDGEEIERVPRIWSRKDLRLDN